LTGEPALEAMLAAWPPLEREHLGEWALRFGGGFTRRSNSVLPIGEPVLPLEEAIERCERRYAARGLPASFQLREGRGAGTLERALRGRGYVSEYPAQVLAGPLPSARPDARIALPDVPSDGWLETWLASRHDDPGAGETARAILEHVSRPRAFACLALEGTVVATALGTVSPGWLGLSCLAVREDARRQGIARAMLGALADWAAGQGARCLWLEVEDENGPALALYRELGLERVGGYSYLTAPSISRTAS
jgi:ribosomal protein S18 acetylase RimI-like enzyme